MKLNSDIEILLSQNVAIISKHIELLKAVEATKSITNAAKKVGISYKNAWDSLNFINNASPKPLIIRENSSKKSGSVLSDYAKNLIKTYENIKNLEQKFLQSLGNIENLNFEQMANLRRFAMQLSARNQLLVKIKEIKKGAVNAEISAVLSSGECLKSVITNTSLENLALKIGDEICFIFKAPSVILGKFSNDDKITKIGVENQLKGVVKHATIGAVNAEIIIEIKGHQNITAIITKESANALKIGVGDEVFAIIKASEIIVGV